MAESVQPTPIEFLPRFCGDGFDVLSQPVWVLDFATERNVYANAAGLRMWGVASVEALKAREVPAMSTVSRTRLEEVIRRSVSGEATFERWTFYTASEPQTFDILMQAVRVDDDHVGILNIGIPVRNDLSDRRAAEALRYSRDQITFFDTEGRALYRNAAAISTYPSDRADLVARFADAAAGGRFLEELRRTGTAQAFVEVATATGPRWHGIEAVATLDPETGGTAYLVGEHDVTALKLAEANLRLREQELHQAQTMAQLGSWRLDLSNQTYHLSRTLSAMLKLGPEPIDAAKASELLHPLDRENFSSLLRGIFNGAESAEGSSRVILHDGDVRHLWTRCAPERDASGKLVAIIAVVRDITEDVRARQRIDFLAVHDGLTELRNRVGFSDALDQALVRTGQAGGCLFMIDIDGFKEINDTRGHAVGDTVLIEIGQRLRNAVEPDGIAARLGGDEFALILPYRTDRRELDEFARRLVADLCAPVMVDDAPVMLAASVGISLWPHDAGDIGNLQRNADLAHYTVKAEGGGFAFFDRSMRDVADKRRWVVDNLPRAMKSGAIEMHYQPLIRLSDGVRVGFEALVRWRDPVRGLIPPDRFIPIVEECGLMATFGSHILWQVAAQIQRWVAVGREPGKVAVNLGAGQLLGGDLVGDLRAILAETGLDPARLELEVTETVTVGRRTAEIVSTLETLREMGIAVVLDDFGTGHASLTHLRRLPIDRIKIDRSFVTNLGVVNADTAVVRAMLDIARTMDLSVVAEGVETEEQLARLVAIECPLAQGYLFGRPLPPEAPDFWRLDDSLAVGAGV